MLDPLPTYGGNHGDLSAADDDAGGPASQPQRRRTLLDGNGFWLSGPACGAMSSPSSPAFSCRDSGSRFLGYGSKWSVPGMKGANGLQLELAWKTGQNGKSHRSSRRTAGEKTI